jgi:dTDP-4-amino-4,6-dideoxygalactose transaminase
MDRLDRRRLANDGSEVQELEEKLAASLNVKHCIARYHVTIALKIAAPWACLVN